MHKYIIDNIKPQHSICEVYHKLQIYFTKSILKLFGAGMNEGLTQGEMDKIMEVHDSFHARRKNGN